MTEATQATASNGVHILPITVRNRIAEYASNEQIICNNTGYRVRFDFDEEWDAYDAKTLRIRYDGEDEEWCIFDIPFNGNECNLPTVQKLNRLFIGVYANNLRTSTDAEILCMFSALSYDGAPEDPPDDVYHTIMENMNTLARLNEEHANEIIREALTEAKNSGEFDGPIGQTGAPGKSAYQYAKDGGYTGTEAEYTAKMSEITYSRAEVDAALGNYITDIESLVGGNYLTNIATILGGNA